MTSMNRCIRCIAAVTGVVVLFAHDKMSPTNLSDLLATADGRIGRPLTPMSYAGVARRTARRGACVAGAARPVLPRRARRITAAAAIKRQTLMAASTLSVPEMLRPAVGSGESS